MTVNPRTRDDATPACRLTPFTPDWAPTVVRWVRDAQEAYWLAPKTPPPLTAAQILGWRKPEHCPYLLFAADHALPVAYGELNRLHGVRRQYWLGHLIVDAARRRRGYGVQLTRHLLHEAFVQRGAHRVTLVVFAENTAALACYRAAGMRDDGFEWHTFPAYGRRECLLRLAASAPPVS
ncbi:MAG TPA: GNAT family N-acetyltransferase [Phycisphaerae bacterium]|jgi:RimJ/RimL family protein N-acetyltransferase|nr:GNAT family N-acetyltransferase [Phycisphaerae bacterium]